MLVARTREATPDSTQAKGQQLTTTVKSNPVPFAAAGALAAGLLIGVLGRPSKVEVNPCPSCSSFRSASSAG